MEWVAGFTGIRKWATKAAYLALDSQQIFQNRGVCDYSFLSELWSENGYHIGIQPLILRLMIRYEICYKKENEDKYLIPSLFPESPPRFSKPEGVPFVFRYKYDFMPSGIMSRFIVRNSNLIKDNICWKNGVMIEDSTAIAVITNSYLERTISIELYGENILDLQGLIRTDFSRINRSLNNPNLVEEIPCVCDKQFMFPYNLIKQLNSAGKLDITCYKCGDKVSIDSILKAKRSTESVGANIIYHHETYMKIKKIENKGSAIIGNHVENSSINSTFNSIHEVIVKFSKTAEEKAALISNLEILKDPSGERDTKIHAKSRLEEFLIRNSEAIGAGTVAAILSELLKLLIF